MTRRETACAGLLLSPFHEQIKIENCGFRRIAFRVSEHGSKRETEKKSSWCSAVAVKYPSKVVKNHGIVQMILKCDGK